MFDDGTRGKASSSSVSLSGVSGFPEESEAEGSVGKELRTTSSWPASNLGGPKDSSSLAESAPDCVASGGGVGASGEC